MRPHRPPIPARCWFLRRSLDVSSNFYDEIVEAEQALQDALRRERLARNDAEWAAERLIRANVLLGEHERRMELIVRRGNW